jgi:hypothetical protein
MARKSKLDDPTVYVEVYKLANAGLPNKQIAKILKCDYFSFRLRIKKDPALRDALIRGRSNENSPIGTEKLSDYIFGRLSPQVRAVWEKMSEYEEEPNGVLKLEKLLQSEGKKTRQQLFLHSFIGSSFSASQACRAVNISWQTFQKWKTKDPEFLSLFEEMLEHKKNFFESRLVDLVMKGDTCATIFVNKTLNRDRGYGEKVTVEGTMEHKHTHAHITVDQLDLPLEVRKVMLDTLREKQQKAQAITVESQ